MSTNPYASITETNTVRPVEYDRTQSASFPKLILFFGITMIVFGGLGTIVALFSVVSSIVTLISPNPAQGGDPFARSIVSQSMEWAPVSIAMGFAGGILSIAMIVVGIGLVQRKLWGAVIGTWLVALILVYKLAELIFGIVMQLQIMEAVSGQMLAKAGGNAPMDPESMKMIMIFGGVFAMVVFSLPMISYHIWAFFYLRSNKPRSFLT